jgi:hypothetical protein
VKAFLSDGPMAPVEEELGSAPWPVIFITSDTGVRRYQRGEIVAGDHPLDIIGYRYYRAEV